MADAAPAEAILAACPPISVEATYPLTAPGKPFGTPKTPASAPTGLDSYKAHVSIRERRQAWTALNLRQEWADDSFMRGHLHMAGLRVKCNTEPATVKRIKAKLRSVGVDALEIKEAVGMPLARWLKVSPGLPLWAALALILESTELFTPDDAHHADGVLASHEPGASIRLVMPTHRRSFVVTVVGQQ
jgi:hypothetical protein